MVCCVFLPSGVPGMSVEQSGFPGTVFCGESLSCENFVVESEYVCMFVFVCIPMSKSHCFGLGILLPEISPPEIYMFDSVKS